MRDTNGLVISRDYGLSVCYTSTSIQFKNATCFLQEWPTQLSTQGNFTAKRFVTNVFELTLGPNDQLGVLLYVHCQMFLELTLV